jgi:hypothetical protein
MAAISLIEMATFECSMYNVYDYNSRLWQGL